MDEVDKRSYMCDAANVVYEIAIHYVTAYLVALTRSLQIRVSCEAKTWTIVSGVIYTECQIESRSSFTSITVQEQ